MRKLMGNPHPSSRLLEIIVKTGDRFIDYKVVGASLRYSQTSMETWQDNIDNFLEYIIALGSLYPLYTLTII